jgi:3-polyprenyl-4-hydroxybenzoate decarboxylase
LNTFTGDVSKLFESTDTLQEDVEVAEIEEVTAKEEKDSQELMSQQKIDKKEAEVETEAQVAKRLKISVPQLKTLKLMKEGALFTLKTPISTKDKNNKSAKTAAMRFINFNDKFIGGFVSFSYSYGKTRLVDSMSAKEFFAKTRVRLK